MPGRLHRGQDDRRAKQPRWRGHPGSPASIGMRCSQVSWSRRARHDGCPRGANLTKWNDDKLSGRRGTIIFTSAAPCGRDSQESSQFKPKSRRRLPARYYLPCGGRPRRRRRSPHSRSRFSLGPPQLHVSRTRHRSSRPPKPNAPGSDLDSRRRFPTRAAAHGNPLPLGLAKQKPSEARFLSASNLCWAAARRFAQLALAVGLCSVHIRL
jgi:hypothetical protein